MSKPIDSVHVLGADRFVGGLLSVGSFFGKPVLLSQDTITNEDVKRNESSPAGPIRSFPNSLLCPTGAYFPSDNRTKWKCPVVRSAHLL